jgi:Beta-lactamase
MPCSERSPIRALAWPSMVLALWLWSRRSGCGVDAPEKPAPWTGLAVLPFVLLWTALAASGSTGTVCSPERPHPMSVTKPGSPRTAERLRVPLLVAMGVVLSVAVLADSLLRSDGTSQTGRRELHGGRPELQRILDDVVTGRDWLAPGVTAFVSGPRATWAGSAGIADIATREPMRSGARMRLRSVSKIYTAALILQLAQARRLHVGDTVERWLPGVLPYGERITIRQLLMMRSGLIDLADVMCHGER